jgi:hypothetical protein
MATPVLPVTHGIVEDSMIAGQMAAAKMNENNVRGTTLQAGDDTPDTGELVHIYNILDREWVVNQPPAFPAFKVPACPKGQKFSVTSIPRFIKERYEVPGSVQYYFKRVDGRKYATSLLNPAAFPGTRWEAQLQVWKTTDQFGNNLNAWGVFWSLTKPDSPALEAELMQFKARVRSTMESLVKQGEAFAAAQQESQITPNMHFAMDYLRRQAKWHMQTEFLVDCPTCGEPVKEGIAYHRNSMNFLCPVDLVKCAELAKSLGMQFGVAAPPTAPQAAPTPIVAPTAGLDEEEAALVGAAATKAKREVAQKTKGAQKK